jgi:3-dehydroquinate synthase
MINVKITESKATVYPILIQSGLLNEPEKWLWKMKSDISSIVIITDNSVKKHYAHTLLRSLEKLKIKTLLLSFPAGEKSKNQKTKQYLEEKMLRHACDRNTMILALGGGVVGDIAGFTAATYMRGISYIQIPTTLLAMVDSSVGGKTAIDTQYGKNLIGAFWQPQAVIADIQCLNTLSRKQLINGLIEAIKIFITNDAESFYYTQRNLQKILNKDENVLKKIINRAVEIKASIVEKDEKEKSGERMICNFGHTIGHAIEMLSDYKILHGFAVGLGILVEAKISQLRGLLDEEQYNQIQSLLSELGVTMDQLKKFDINQILKATILDKKSKSGKAQYVLVEGIGRVHVKQNKFAHPVTDRIVRQAVQSEKC